MSRADTVVLWALRVVWLTLPLSAGDALAGTTADWEGATRVTAAVLVWSAWAVGVLAVLAPRSPGLTAMRVLAPVAVVVAVACARDVGGVSGVSAVVATVAAALLALGPTFAPAAVNGASYGDERRFPLRIPPALFLGPLPLAIALVAGGIAAGPLLVGAGHWVLGGLAIVVGVPVALAALRSLHGLSRRWAVLVPAGLVLVDAAILGDPVLFRRERVHALGPLAPGTRPDAGELDLRMGAQRGAVALVLDAESDMIHVRRGRRRSELAPARVVWFVPARRDAFLATAGARRLRVVDGEPGPRRGRPEASA